LKRKEAHEADEAKAQGTLAAAAEPPKHKKARTDEENTERGKGAAEQVRHHLSIVPTCVSKVTSPSSQGVGG